MKVEPAPLRVVLDTNVLISALLSKTGAPAQLVHRVFAHHTPVWSQACFAELESRLWKPKFDRYASLDDRRSFLMDARSIGLWVDITAAMATQKFSRDPDDDKFVHTALAADAQWLVSGDQDLLLLAPIQGLKVLTPAQALL